MYIGFSLYGVSYVFEAVGGCMLFFLLKTETLSLSNLPRPAVPTVLRCRSLFMKRFVIKVIPIVDEIDFFLFTK